MNVVMVSLKADMSTVNISAKDILTRDVSHSVMVECENEFVVSFGNPLTPKTFAYNHISGIPPLPAQDMYDIVQALEHLDDCNEYPFENEAIEVITAYRSTYQVTGIRRDGPIGADVYFKVSQFPHLYFKRASTIFPGINPENI